MTANAQPHFTNAFNKRFPRQRLCFCLLVCRPTPTILSEVVLAQLCASGLQESHLKPWILESFKQGQASVGAVPLAWWNSPHQQRGALLRSIFTANVMSKNALTANVSNL